VKQRNRVIFLRRAGLATALGVSGVVAALILAGPGEASSAAVNRSQDRGSSVVTLQPTSGVPANVIPATPVVVGKVPVASVSGGTTSAPDSANDATSSVTLQPTSGVPANVIPATPVVVGTVAVGSATGSTTSAAPGTNG
jgi:hypothetical protein